MTAFKIEELSGQLIKSGRFIDAIDVFFYEIDLAQHHGVISKVEMSTLQREFSLLLLNPNSEGAAELGHKMLSLVMRIPGKLPIVSLEEFDKNVKDSRET